MNRLKTGFLVALFLVNIHSTQVAATLVWTEKANFGGEARHRAIGFSIGNRGYMGLGHYNAIVDVLFEDIWEFDPGTNTWTQKADFPGGKRLQCASFTINGIGYVGTGRDPFFIEHDDFYAYNPITNT